MSNKMLQFANLPQELWAEAVPAGAWLYNMSPAHRNSMLSPKELLTKSFRIWFRWYTPEITTTIHRDLRPSWHGIYAYGCRAYPLTKDREAERASRTHKVQPCARIGYLVGYEASNIYRIWILQLSQVIVTCNVTFDEELFFEHNFEQGALSIKEAKDLSVSMDEVFEVNFNILHEISAWQDLGDDLHRASSPLDPASGGGHLEQQDSGGGDAQRSHDAGQEEQDEQFFDAQEDMQSSSGAAQDPEPSAQGSGRILLFPSP